MVYVSYSVRNQRGKVKEVSDHTESYVNVMKGWRDKEIKCWERNMKS